MLQLKKMLPIVTEFYVAVPSNGKIYPQFIVYLLTLRALILLWRKDTNNLFLLSDVRCHRVIRLSL
ncbi:protein of unknown function [Xenorhabdus poinarii G6]|uniref:Uncharacterized protein n=1 Tax=Xenorhabdus poinarii G6 TaxID=1354304 RepID=A0A068R6D8_9GAMM|nr:protein of unknown function [Xenorhabdus poinarii G6]